MTDQLAFAYSITVAAKLAGIGRTKLYEQIADGQLEARKVGRRTLIMRRDLESWLAKLPRHETL